jgi:hypothetical protein
VKSQILIRKFDGCLYGFTSWNAENLNQSGPTKSTSVGVHPKSEFQNSQNLSKFEQNMVDYG